MLRTTARETLKTIQYLVGNNKERGEGESKVPTVNDIRYLTNIHCLEGDGKGTR